MRERVFRHKDRNASDVWKSGAHRDRNDRAVLSNLLTQPDVTNPDLYQFSSRALGHAWKSVRPDVEKAFKDALKALDPSGKVVASTLETVLKQ